MAVDKSRIEVGFKKIPALGDYGDKGLIKSYVKRLFEISANQLVKKSESSIDQIIFH